MVKKIIFAISGIPKAQRRHRHTKSGHVYDPSKKNKAEFLLQSMKYKPKKPLESAKLTIIFRFKRPKSHYGKHGLKKSAPEVHNKRPDVDNLAKFVMDALDKVFFVDDGCVHTLVASKEYANRVNLDSEKYGGETLVEIRL